MSFAGLMAILLFLSSAVPPKPLIVIKGSITGYTSTSAHVKIIIEYNPNTDVVWSCNAEEVGGGPINVNAYDFEGDIFFDYGYFEADEYTVVLESPYGVIELNGLFTPEPY